MATILVVYDTKYGQTEKIAQFVASLARQRGHAANAVHVGAIAASAQLDVADGVVVLAPVFVGKHMPSVAEFVSNHRRELASRPTAFFSISGSAGSPKRAEREQARRIADELLAQTQWRPRVVACFGGKIDYPRYNVFIRFVMKQIAKRNGGSTDTSRAHELTDWAAVERTTTDFLTQVELVATAGAAA